MSSKALALAFVAEIVVIGALLALSLDVYAHKRVERLGGVNIWGYRGAVARVKQPGEIRVAMVGGTMAFGWGIAASETAIESVRQLVALSLDRPGREATHVTALNLGAIGWPASAYRDRLSTYYDLRIDVVCVYPDPIPAPLGVPLPPRDSAAAAWTGYAPILPLVLEEKGERLGWRPAGSAVRRVGRMLRTFDRALFDTLIQKSREVESLEPLSAIEATVDGALSMARGVVVALPAPLPGRFGTGLERLEERLATRFGRDGRVRVVDLARDPRLQESDGRLDGVSYGAGGNAAIGEDMTPAVLELLSSRTTTSQ